MSVSKRKLVRKERRERECGEEGKDTHQHRSISLMIRIARLGLRVLIGFGFESGVASLSDRREHFSQPCSRELERVVFRDCSKIGFEELASDVGLELEGEDLRGRGSKLGVKVVGGLREERRERAEKRGSATRCRSRGRE